MFNSLQADKAQPARMRPIGRRNLRETVTAILHGHESLLHAQCEVDDVGETHVCWHCWLAEGVLRKAEHVSLSLHVGMS
jgi:hypothetical protein